MAKAKRSEGPTTIRMDAETHARLRDLAARTGISQIRLLRALSFSSPEDYSRCEKRRLAALERGDNPTG